MNTLLSLKNGFEAEKASLDLLGYSAPLPLTEPKRLTAVLERNSAASNYIKNPHIAQTEISVLLSDPGLVEWIGKLCGSNLKLWRSALFSKEKGSKIIGWHHDKHFYEDGVNDIRLDEIGSHYSVLFGLTDIVQNNGQIEVLPGTHREQIGVSRDTRPFHMRPPNEHIIENLPEALLVGRRPVPIPANCFMVFHSALLHRSLEHYATEKRLGLAIRLAPRNFKVPTALANAEEIFNFPPIS